MIFASAWLLLETAAGSPTMPEFLKRHVALYDVDKFIQLYKTTSFLVVGSSFRVRFRLFEARTITNLKVGIFKKQVFKFGI